MRPALAVALLFLLAACGGGRSGIGAGDTKRLVELAHANIGGQVLSVAWSPDGGRVAAGGPRGVVVLEAGTGRRERTLPTGGSQVWGVAWSKYGIAAGSEDGVVRTWRGGRSSALERVPGGAAFSVDWSRDGKLAVGYANGSVRMGKSTFGAHRAEVIAVAWSHDGRSLASGSIDTTIVVRRGGSAARFGRPEGADVNGLAWSPDDDRVVAANQDGAVRIWEVRKRKVALRLRGHEGWARGVAWSPNGDLVASAAPTGWSGSGTPRPRGSSGRWPLGARKRGRWRGRPMGPSSPPATAASAFGACGRFAEGWPRFCLQSATFGA